MVMNFLSLTFILHLFFFVSIIFSMFYTLLLPITANSESLSKDYLNYSSLLPVRFEKAELYNDSEKVNFSYYNSPNYGINIKYPYNWSIIESENSIDNNYRILTLSPFPEYDKVLFDISYFSALFLQFIGRRITS